MVESHAVAARNHKGSATVVAVKIENENTLSSTNIGDSGYQLFHVIPQEDGTDKLELYYRSEEK